MCLFWRDVRLQGAHNLSGRARAQLQLPCSLLPCLHHSHCIPKMLTISICCPEGPCTSVFRCKPKGRARSLCNPYSHNCLCSLLRACSAPRIISHLSAKENRLACASLCILTSARPTANMAGEGSLNIRILWEQGWYWKQTPEGTISPPGLSHLCTPQLCVVPWRKMPPKGTPTLGIRELLFA